MFAIVSLLSAQHVGQQRQEAGALDGFRQLTLLLA
jgi:hypothetical protein